jgi:hypothetical protein
MAGSAYITIIPGLLRIRVSRRGVRTAIGPRWLRFHFGPGGQGVSSGAGPFTYYRPARRRRRPARRR